MGRKCSHYGDNSGHNSRTCSNDINRSTAGGLGLRLFGVQLPADPSPDMKKKSFTVKSSSASPLTISSSAPSMAASSSSSSSPVSVEEAADKIAGSYLSSEALAQERKKGIPWTEEEHERFLAGLAKLGKGDWRGISRYFVTTRTPTQVASHAQKFFLRQTSTTSRPLICKPKRHRRSSLFDDDDDVDAAGTGSHRRCRRSSTASAQRPRGKDDAGVPGDSTAQNADCRDGGRSARCRAIDLNSVEEDDHVRMPSSFLSTPASCNCTIQLYDYSNSKQGNACCR